MVKQVGRIKDVSQGYAMNAQTNAHTGDFARSSMKGDGRVELISYRVTNAEGKALPLPVTKEDLLIQILLRARESIDRPAYGISLYNEAGVLMTSINTVEQGCKMPPLPAGDVRVCVRVNKTAFLPGNYTASFWVMNPQGDIYVMTENSIAVKIAQTPLYGTCRVDGRWGCVYSDIKLMTDRAPEYANDRV